MLFKTIITISLISCIHGTNLELVDEQGVAASVAPVDRAVCRICSRPVLSNLQVLPSGATVHQLCLVRLRANPVVNCPLRRDIERHEPLTRLWNSDMSIFLIMAMMDYQP